MSFSPRPSAWLVIFGVAAVLGALLWATVHALRLERSEAASRSEAEFQESIRLALWRMDSALAPLLTREAARPYFHYSAFYPADRAYTSMWKAVEPGEVLVPSPLLQAHEPFVRLHFQIDDRGQITSPEAPTGTLRRQLEAANVPTTEVIDAEMSLVELDRFFAVAAPPRGDRKETASIDAATKQESEERQTQAAPYQQAEPARDSPLTQREYGKRQQVLQNVLPPEQQRAAAPSTESASKLRKEAAEAQWDESDKVLKSSSTKSSEVTLGIKADTLAEGAAAAISLAPPTPTVEIGDMKPVWKHDSRDRRDELFLTRTVKLASGSFVQGCWLDWPALKASLLTSVTDLFPKADLVPSTEPSDSTTSGRMLAGIPAAILPGPPPTPPAIGWTPMRTTLVITWGAVLLTMNALAFALFASRELAERRGRFVSAVTHELRTPLTTFTLYSQMLADGIVRDDAARSEYLGTLKHEAQRLARIVENVLEYARLGKSGTPAHARRISLPELTASVLPALTQRALQARATLRCEPPVESLPAVDILADPVTVERILFNLVDNACKYAPAAPIELAISINPATVEVAVQDHGPGIPSADRALVFKPFERGRSLEHATTPGLGLGLALSRELARRLGGDLRLVNSSRPGTQFVLTLIRPPA